MAKNWTLLKNGNFTKLLILILLGYVIGVQGVTKIIDIGSIP